MARSRISRSQGCPPGVLCLSNSYFYIFIIIGFAIAAYFLYQGQQVSQQQQPIVLAQAQPQQQQAPTNVFVSRGGDDRYTRAPEPLRIWNGLGPAIGVGGGGLGFSTTSLPFNIPTQGYPQNFSSVGIITTEDGQVLPLYGRPSSYNSDRYNYYTRTDTYNPVPLPVKFEKRDCMDDTGCQEVFSKDKVHISAMGKEATAHIFKFDAPKYVPTI